MNPMEHVAALLAEVKLAEKRLAKAQEKLEPTANRIRAALRAGDRATAEKLAGGYEQQKEEVTLAEQAVAQAKEAYETGKRGAKTALVSQKTLKTTTALGGALGAMHKAMDTASAAQDALQKLEEETAMSEARLDVLMKDAEDRLPPELKAPPGGAPAAPPPPPINTAEDILKEFE
jgi:hypothetical protein